MSILSVAAAIFLPLALLTELVSVDYEGIAGREQSLEFLVLPIVLVAVEVGLSMLVWRPRGRFL